MSLIIINDVVIEVENGKPLNLVVNNDKIYINGKRYKPKNEKPTPSQGGKDE